jgi:hypothetical protein
MLFFSDFLVCIIGENTLAAIEKMPKFQGYYDNMRCKGYKILLNDVKVECLADDNINALLQLFLVNLALNPTESYGLNIDVKYFIL